MNTRNYGTPVPPNGAESEQTYSRPASSSAQNTPGAVHHASAGNAKKQGGTGKSFLAGFLGGIVSIALALCLANFTPLFNVFKGGSVSSSNGNITINAQSEDTTLAEAVAAKDLDSVVTIYVYSDAASGLGQGYGSSGSSSSPSGLGSGVVISSENGECYILTNYHVVEGISRATVKAANGEYEAEAVGYDAKTDLAVLKIKADGLKAIEWGDPAEVNVGDWVMAIGSPYGYEQTVTTGIVSAMYRSDVLSGSSGGSSTVYTDMIQTDAAINPGNSGGALVNDKGQLIGINTYISSKSQSSAGLGFAIPVSTAKSVADQLMAGKSVTHSFLGISMGSSSNPQGVAVTAVYKGTAAAEAGLQTGDVITKIDGKAVTSPNEVSVAVRAKNVGDQIEITYVRNGSEKTAKATLGSDDANTNEYAENGAPATQGNRNGNSGNGNSGGGSNGFDLGELFGYGSGGSGGSGSSNGGGFWN